MEATDSNVMSTSGFHQKKIYVSVYKKTTKIPNLYIPTSSVKPPNPSLGFVKGDMERCTYKVILNVVIQEELWNVRGVSIFKLPNS